MNLKQALALCVLTSTGSVVLADDATIVDDRFMATKSRAEVQAEVLKACAEGSLIAGGDVLRMPAMAQRDGTPLTREQVRAQITIGAPLLAASLLP